MTRTKKQLKRIWQGHSCEGSWLRNLQKKFDWDDEDLDIIEIFEDELLATARPLEKNWQQNQPNYSDKELIDIFGKETVQEIVEQKIKKYQKKRKALIQDIKKRFSRVSQFEDADEFTRWFCEEAIDEFYVKKLIKVEKHLARLYRQQKIARGENVKQLKRQFSQEKIEEARQYPIQRIVMNFKKAKKRGNHIYAICPFHSEKHPSFVAYLETNSWYCFGKCSEGGDVIDLTQKLNNLNFKEAIKFLIT